MREMNALLCYVHVGVSDLHGESSVPFLKREGLVPRSDRKSACQTPSGYCGYSVGKRRHSVILPNCLSFVLELPTMSQEDGQGAKLSCVAAICKHRHPSPLRLSGPT